MLLLLDEDEGPAIGLDDDVAIDADDEDALLLPEDEGPGVLFVPGGVELDELLPPPLLPCPCCDISIRGI
jgi:hypothetical protein